MIQDTRTHRYSLKYGPLLTIAVILIAGSADAAGFGAYVGYARSEGEVEGEIFVDIEADHERDAAEFGFVLDTNLAQDRLFNYRLHVGFMRGKREYTVTNVNGIDLDCSRFDCSFKDETFGVAIDNTFGFGVLRTRTVRLWIGPTIRLAIDGCTDCSGYDSTFIGFGAGPTIGLNINIGDHFTVGPSLGYNYMLGANVVDSDGDDEAFTGGQHQISLLFNFFYRSGSDNFDSK
jgi:hypothetical protein